MELLNVAVSSNNPLFLSLILLFFSLLVWPKLAERKTLNLPPSPPKLPIIGNIHQFGKLPHRSLRDLSRKYGSLLLLHMGHKPTLLVSSPDMVREIVKNHDIVFSERPKTTAANILLYGCRALAVLPYGEYWRQVRKMYVVKLFNHRRVNSFQFVRDGEVEVVINKISGACLEGESINLTEMLMFVSSSIVSQCVLSHKSEGEDGCTKLGQLSQRLFILFGGFCFGDMFPYLSWLDVVTGNISRLKSCSAELDAFFDKVLQEHTSLESDTQVAAKDFVSFILEHQKDGKFGMEFTQDNIKANLLDMLVVGTDTTASSATTTQWMMAELLKHPNAMKRVQEEVRNVVGNKPKIDVEDVSKMKYLKCLLKETLRLNPAAPILVPRKTSASVKLGGYDVPSGTVVLVNAWAIQRDPKWWENPEEFIPERFENSSIDFNGEDFNFIPFGYGRRGCPGWLFAIASVEYLMANLLYWFDWKLPPGEIAEEVDMTEIYGLTVARKTPLNILPTSHLSS